MNVFVAAIVSCSALAAADRSQAKALFKAQKWAQARTAYEEVLPQLSGNEAAEALVSIGYCWQRQHKHAETVAVLRKVLEMEGIAGRHVASACARMGYSLRLLKKDREAIDVLLKAAETPGAMPDQLAEALLYAAWAYRNQSEIMPAAELFRRIETIEGVHANYVATAYLNLGRLLQEESKYEDAIAEYRQVAALSPVAANNRSRARVFILECEALLAGDNPFHIKPYVTKVDSSSAKILWVSQGKTPAAAVTVSDGQRSLRIEPKGSPISKTICTLHRAVAEGLTPHARHTYTVQCSGQEVKGSFKTPPKAGGASTFCVIGDTQSYNPSLQPLLDAMGEENPDFVIHVGDITDRGDLWGEWKASFFDPGRCYLSKTVLWPVAGNHDGGPYLPTLFELRRRFYYSFDYGDAHFVVLDSYWAGTGRAGRKKQLEWLRQDLEANDRPWVIVALHVPMVATRTGLRWFGKDDFLPLLEAQGVDIVFSGHHPHYRRYLPIGPKGAKPLLHITSGGGGGPVGGSIPSPLLARGVDVHHYTVVTIDGNRLNLFARDIKGRIIDRYELVKDEAAYQKEVMASAVETRLAEQIVSLCQELLTDRTLELVLALASKPEPGGRAQLTLDLSNLPRGPLDISKAPPGAEVVICATESSPWTMPRQSFKLAAGKGTFEATAPQDVVVKGGTVSPGLEIVIRLRIADRLFEPCPARARLRLASPGK